MADYKLRVEIDVDTFVKQMNAALKKVGMSQVFGGGSGKGVLGQIQNITGQLNQQTSTTEKLIRLRAKLNMEQIQANKLKMIETKLYSKEIALIRASGSRSKTFRNIAGFFGGGVGGAVGNVADELLSLKKLQRERKQIINERFFTQGRGLVEKAQTGQIGPLEFIKKSNELKSKTKEEMASVSKAVPMKLIGIGAGLLAGAGLSKMIIDSSPLLQAMLKLLNVGIMLILRPIGDFIGFMLKPLLIQFVKKVAIPAYKGGFKLAKQWGDSLGKAMLEFLSDPLGAITAAIFNALTAWTRGQAPKTSFLAGMTYDENKPEGALTPEEFLGIKDKEYEAADFSDGLGGLLFPNLTAGLLEPLDNFLKQWADVFSKMKLPTLPSLDEIGLLFMGAKEELLKILQPILRFIGDMNVLFQKTIPSAFRTLASDMESAFRKLVQYVLMAWGKMNAFFQKELPQLIRTLADDIGAALKSIPTKFLNWLEESIFGPKNTQTPGGKPTTGWDPMKDIKNWFDKTFGTKTPIGTPGQFDLKESSKNLIKGGAKTIGPQMLGEALYWQFGEPYLREKIPAYDQYAQQRDEQSAKNFNSIWEFLFGKGNNEIGELQQLTNSNPFAGRGIFKGSLTQPGLREGPSNFIGPMQPMQGLLRGSGGNSNGIWNAMFQENDDEKYKQVKETAEKINGHRQEELGYSQDSLFSMEGIKDNFGIMEQEVDSARVYGSDITEGFYKLWDKVQKALNRMSIQRTSTGKLTSTAKAARATRRILNTDSVVTSNKARYKLTYPSGETRILELDDQALEYYNRLRGQGKGPLSIIKMARGGIINEPILGFGQKTGRQYMMGENGPETVTPGANTNPSGTGSSPVFNITINASNVGDIERQLKPAILKMLKESTARAGIV